MHGLQINKSTYNIYKYTAFLSIAVIFLIGVAFLQPFSFTENTNATTERTTNGDYYIETTTTDLNLTINTTPAGAQETASHDVTVKTDDPAGYTLTVSVNNDTSNALNLNGNTSATEKFNATSGTYDTPKALDENSWGFADTLTKKNNDQWAAVPLLKDAQQIKQTSSANTSGDTTTMYYAINAKYDGQHSNGDYSNTITYSVIGNAVVPTKLENGLNMQDVTADMCANSANTTTSSVNTYELTDTRNSEKYYVRKFTYYPTPVSFCIMVENLYLEGGTTITYKDSNISNTTTTSLPSGGTGIGSYTLPESNTSGFNRTTQSMYNGGRARNGESYDGSSYDWVVATAGTGGGANVDKWSSGDICPKNWAMLNYSDGVTFLAAMSHSPVNFFASSDGGNSAIIPTNRYWYGSSNTNGAHWWTSMQMDSYNAYNLAAGNDQLLSSNTDKSTGIAVRCAIKVNSY